MNPYSRNRQFPAGNPLANALVVIVGALVIGLSFVVGIVAFVALAAIMLVLGAVIGIRVWWHNRTLGQVPQSPGQAGQPGIIEGEYRVVSSSEETDQREQ